MSKFSTIAAVTLGLRDMIKAAMPPMVEVTTLPAAMAQTFVVQPGVRARVNVMFLRASVNTGFRNLSPGRDRDAVGVREALGGELGLHYLITVYGTADPEEEQSTERLFEGVHGVIMGSPVVGFRGSAPVLAEADSASNLDGARVLVESLSIEDIYRVFSALRAEYRPTLACVAMPSPRN